MILSRATMGRAMLRPAGLLLIAVLAANVLLYPGTVLFVLIGGLAVAIAFARVDLVVWAVVLLSPVETVGPVTFLMTKTFKLGLAILAVAVIYSRSGGRDQFGSDPYRWPLLVMASSGFFSSLLAKSPWTSMTGLFSILIFIFIYRSLRAWPVSAATSRRVLSAVMRLGAFCSVLCVAQLLFGYDGALGSPEQRAMQAEGVMDTFWPEIERGSATLNGPSAAGAFCAMAAVIAFTRGLYNRSFRCGLVALVCAAGVLATFSRGALLGLLAGCCFAWWAVGSLSKKRLGLIAAVATPLLVLCFASEDVRNYLRLGSDLVSVSESRVDAWQATRTILARHPVWGIGFYEFREFAQGIEGFSDTPLHPHNGFLKALVEEGPIGGLGYLFYFAVFLKTSWRARKQNAVELSGHSRPDWRWAHASIAGAGASLFTQELFDANLTIGGSSIAILFAVFLAIQVSLLNRRQCETAFSAGGFALAT